MEDKSFLTNESNSEMLTVDNGDCDLVTKNTELVDSKGFVDNNELVDSKVFDDNVSNNVLVDTNNLVDTDSLVDTNNLVDTKDVVDGKVNNEDDAVYNMNHRRRGLVTATTIKQHGNSFKKLDSFFV